MCFDASWKREEIPDHKFDHIDVREFKDHSLRRKVLYLGVFIMTLKAILAYAADLGAVLLVFSTSGLTNIFANATTGVSDISYQETINIPPSTKLTIISASVFVSFLLLYHEWKKAEKIIRSRDISYAFTSVQAYRYYAIKSYDHYCFCKLFTDNLVSQIQNSRKLVDLVAFFIYFRFKGWKRLLLAEAPRQFLNFMYIYDVTKLAQNHMPNPKNLLGVIPTIYAGLGNTQHDKVTTATYVILCITFAFWACGLIATIGAFILYIPLLYQIRGNLKEYCVHKIDKRVAQLLKRKLQKRVDDQILYSQNHLMETGSLSSEKTYYHPNHSMHTI